jgi:hypothetical protein
MVALNAKTLSTACKRGFDNQVNPAQSVREKQKQMKTGINKKRSEQMLQQPCFLYLCLI